MHRGDPLVLLHHVVKRYGSGSNCVVALRGVSLAVHPWECLAVVGPSGSGKSTLLNLMGGIETPDEGTIQVAGQDLSGRSEDERAVLRRRTIGVVYQSFNLIASLTVEENVALPLFLDSWSRRQARGKVRAMMRAVGLEGRAHHRPAELSGGEMQRAAIARALVGDPLLVLADEPTGNLDTKQGEVILVLLRALASQRGRAVVVVTHDVRAAERCGRVIELRDGCVVQAEGIEDRKVAMMVGAARS